jgi:hypothetical protein
MANKIEECINRIKEKHKTASLVAERAIVMAPFGDRPLREAIQNLGQSKAIQDLIRSNNASVLIITSKPKSRISTPPEIGILQIDHGYSWPKGDQNANRFFKWALPFLFPNIRLSLYLDSDLVITHRPDKLLALFERIEKEDFVVTDHLMRRGWRDEFNAVLYGKKSARGGKNYTNKQNILKQMKLFSANRIPALCPVFINSFIGRKHGSPHDDLSQAVLEYLLRFGERDQLALIHSCWETGLRPLSLPEGEILYTNHVLGLNPETLCFIESQSFARAKGYLGRKDF